ncbi:M20/M25/M40 family metallo-hydrolase [Spirosoma sp. KCTC 42546]|uniref:M20/M25/M40 family metallo-hydrolase n=1 Tax=Spirosoma sp. KCTC 42546 TaxID=2520506 RepID=UPI0011593526|nr:M20/M25/M40 family metallo-hydrolase [Spirosoma sp. KCTC 42546]QDK82275.1 M20/M25/M40 family metallo-hydrolase [Spirosoma sp. KCTC 42546]
MKIYFVFLLTLLTNTTFGQEPSATRITKHIHKLASDKMQGRGTGSPENAKAARYVEKYFKKYGLKPLGTDGYYQSFTAKVRRVVVPDSLRKAANVIGFLDNGAPYTIVIGAHYDHLGLGRQGSSLDSLPQGKIHNGADDNASGVAGLLEIAHYFTKNGVKEPYNFLFMAFGAEELGLQGSRYFLNNPTLPLDKLNFMVCMDMIGRYNPDRGVGIGGYGTSDTWPIVFKGAESSIKFFTDRAGNGGSDNAAFYAKQIPVLFFHTGGHPDYHKPSDDPDKIDAKAEEAILRLEIKLLLTALQQPKMTFTPVK